MEEVVVEVVRVGGCGGGCWSWFWFYKYYTRHKTLARFCFAEICLIELETTFPSVQRHYKKLKHFFLGFKEHIEEYKNAWSVLKNEMPIGRGFGFLKFVHQFFSKKINNFERDVYVFNKALPISSSCSTPPHTSPYSNKAHDLKFYPLLNALCILSMPIMHFTIGLTW